MLSTAAQLQHGYDLEQRLQMRSAALDTGEDYVSEVPRLPGREPVMIRAERIIHKMQRFLDLRVQSDDILLQLSRLESLEIRGCAQGRQLWLQGNEIVAEALRYEGGFREAEIRYKLVLDECADSPPEQPGPSCRVTASYAEILCELGQPDKALAFLRDVLKGQPAGTRLGLAVGHAYLMGALWEYQRLSCQAVPGNSSTEQGLSHWTQLITSRLEEAKERYRYYQDVLEHSRTPLGVENKNDYFVACAGFAITLHVLALLPADALQKEDHASLVLASSAWRHAQKAAQQRWQQPGFYEAMTILSQSDLAFHLDHGEAERLVKAARRSGKDKARQYSYIALGTIWSDILESRDSQRQRTTMRSIIWNQ